jgi:hypothetical protein
VLHAHLLIRAWGYAREEKERSTMTAAAERKSW